MPRKSRHRKRRGKEPGKSYARENKNKDLSYGITRTRGNNKDPDVPDRRKVTVFPRTSHHRGMRDRIAEELDAYYDSICDDEVEFPLYASSRKSPSPEPKDLEKQVEPEKTEALTAAAKRVPD